MRNQVPDDGGFRPGTSDGPTASMPDAQERGRPSGGRVVGIVATLIVMLGILAAVVLL